MTLRYVAIAILALVNLASLCSYLNLIKAWSVTDPTTYPTYHSIALFFSSLFILVFLLQARLGEAVEKIRSSPLNNRLVIAFGIFFMALAIRMLFYYYNQDTTIGRVSISGIPFSDASNWNDLAIDIAQGKGMTGNWSARMRHSVPRINSLA